MVQNTRTNLVRYQKVIIIMLFCLVSARLLAQTGSLEGFVLDKSSNVALIGATVSVDGTSQATISDVDGRYRLTNVKAGFHFLKVTYMGYIDSKIENVQIFANKTIQINAMLAESEIAIEEVTVSTKRRAGSEASMISAIKASQLVTSGISSSQIQKSQDKDASEVIRRVPGVTINDDRFVIVRGLNQRYNNVWLNNSSTPSSEADVRAFSFDVIPSGMIDNLTVYKSGAPELPADFSGGFINIVTKNIPDTSFIAIDYLTGYRGSTTFKDFKSFQGGKLDWLAIDDGTRALPTGFPSDWSNVESNAAQMNSLTKKFQNTYAISANKARPDQKIGITLAKRMKLGKVIIGNMTVLNYSNSNKCYSNNNNAFATYNTDYDTLTYKYKYVDRVYCNNISWSILHNWGFVFNDRNKIEFRNIFNQNGFTRTSVREGQFLENFRDERSFQERFMSRTTYSGQLGGEHSFRQGVTKLNWGLGYSLANRDEPDRKVMVSSKDENTGKYQFIINQGNPQPNFAGRFYQKTIETILSSSINFEHKFALNMIVPTLKAGYFGEFKNREFTARNIGYITGSQFSTYPDSILYLPVDKIFNQENLDYNSKISIAEQTNKSDSYSANNRLFAGYIALNIPLFYKFNIYGGIRAEHNDLNLSSFKQDQPDVPVKVNNKKLNLFPSANVSFNITRKTLLRLAYGRSVNRPEFREIAPYYFIDFERNASFRGNPSLKDADIQNIDLRFEHYPANGETFSFAFFYKKFVNPIEAVISNEGSGKSFTFANAAGAVNYGVELDIRKVLSNQGFLQNFSVVANGSLIKSLVMFEGDEKLKSHNRPLQGQSPYIANVGLFFNKANTGLTISALYNVIGKRIYAVGIVNQNNDSDIPDEYEMPRNIIDFTIVKKIGRLVEIKLGIKDLLNQPVEYRQIFSFTNKNGAAQERSGNTNYYHPGSVYSIGVSLKF